MHMPPFDDHPVSEDWERLMVEHQHKEAIGQALVVDTKTRHFMRSANEKLKSLPTAAASQLVRAAQLTPTKEGYRFLPWDKLAEELLRDKHFFQFVLRAAMARLYGNSHGFTTYEIVATLTQRPLESTVDFCEEWFLKQQHNSKALLSWTFHMRRDRKEIGRDANELIADDYRTRGEGPKNNRTKGRPDRALGLKDADCDPTQSLQAEPSLSQHEQAQIAEEISKLLEYLPEPKREVMQLWLAGVEETEIAECLGIGLSTVYVRIKKAIEILKGLS